MTTVKVLELELELIRAKKFIRNTNYVLYTLISLALMSIATHGFGLIKP